MNKPLSQFAGRYHEWKPAMALREHLSRVWVNDLSDSTTRDIMVVPDGCVDILWAGGGLYVAGPDTRPILEQVRPGCCVSGIRFRPGAARLWLGTPLSEILNSRLPLAEFWKEEAALVEERVSMAPHAVAAAEVLQETLLYRLARVGYADRQIAFLRNKATAIFGDANVSGLRELSCHMGVSERTLRRQCTDAFGYGFKTLQRILRFQRLFHLAVHSRTPNLANLAFESGFADHAHMSREVRRLCDATPSELISQFSR